MSTQPDNAQEDRPGSAEAAEEPTADGYGNDTGFADAAEQADVQADGDAQTDDRG